MSVMIAPDSAEGIERGRWDRPKNTEVNGVKGMRCVGHEEYPKAMHKAGRPNMGNVQITGSMTVHSEAEELVMRGQGWRANPADAVALVHAEHLEHAKLAANRAYHEQTMSPAAQAEAAAKESGTVFHVPSIPETPIRRRGRPSRATKASIPQ